MKQTKFFTGGHPRSVDDLECIQGGVTEAFKSMMKSLVESTPGVIPNCILWGLEETSGSGGATNVSAGAVLLDGEICEFAASSFSGLVIPPTYRTLTTSDVYPATNPVTYADASSRDVHLNRIAVLTTVNTGFPTAANQLEYFTAPRLESLLRAKIMNNDTWHTVGAPSEPALHSNYASNGIKFRRTPLDSVMFVMNQLDLDYWQNLGSIPDVHTSTEKLFTLPINYRPTFTTYKMAPIDLSVYPQEVIGLRIETNGDIFVGVIAAPPTGISPGTYNGKVVNFNDQFSTV